MEAEPQSESFEHGKATHLSLVEAIAGSEVGMALTTTATGHLILVHMHEEDTAYLGHIFNGTTWLHSISMETGVSLVPQEIAISYFASKDEQLRDLQNLGIYLERGWMSIQNASW
jgi:hypothetical protein